VTFGFVDRGALFARIRLDSLDRVITRDSPLGARLDSASLRPVPCPNVAPAVMREISPGPSPLVGPRSTPGSASISDSQPPPGGLSEPQTLRTLAENAVIPSPRITPATYLVTRRSRVCPGGETSIGGRIHLANSAAPTTMTMYARSPGNFPRSYGTACNHASPCLTAWPVSTSINVRTSVKRANVAAATAMNVILSSRQGKP
jgi:hypothetical protein